jgi:hypothetical protein
MSYLHQTTAGSPEGERLVRLISYAGLMALPVLMLFVHMLLIYRA